MATRWETRDSVWLEDEGGQFALAASRDIGAVDWRALARGRIPDVAYLLGAALPGACAHGAIFPEGFAFCPQCGAALHNKAAPALPAWWGASNAALPDGAAPLPKYVPQGLAISALPLARALETRKAEPFVGQTERRLPKPPNVPCVFAAADFGFAEQRLLALAYSRAVLQYWDPLAAAWQLLSGDGQAADLAFTASAYAWLPTPGGRRGDVALLPSGQGLVRLRIDPIGETYHTELVFAARLASAPGAVLRHIACLYAEDGVALWSARADASEAQTWPCPAGVPEAGWSRPLSYDDCLFWLHEAGQLRWQPGLEPQWLAWPEGWTPRLEFGAVTQSHDGRLWQIGKDAHGYAFLELGRRDGQLERVDGARPGFGKFLFQRGHQVRNDPWNSPRVDDVNKNDALVLPLLENLVPGRDAPSGLVLRIEPFTGTVESAMGGAALNHKTVVEWIGERNVILDEVIGGIASPADCVPFVYDNCLWLHHPKWHEIRGWQLKAMP
ncbi:hypothetical protein [Janthinobacterium sp.]|uniref:hypothetical protein n=1 Tax=Janthinobacterium sp. TaxID=1871054 RepID=UPI00293D80CE|nr:hypothetical protein [Janthinobacterium sp.]